MNSVTCWKISCNEVCCKSMRRRVSNNREGLRNRRGNVNWTNDKAIDLGIRNVTVAKPPQNHYEILKNPLSHAPPINEKNICLKVLRLRELVSLTTTVLRSSWVWNTSGKILKIENRKTQGSISRNASLYTINLIQSSLGSNQGSPIVVCLTTGPYSLPWRVPHRVRSIASSFKFPNPLISSRSSRNCLRLLHHLPFTSIFPSITYSRW
jgi:hypothetical protein